MAATSLSLVNQCGHPPNGLLRGVQAANEAGMSISLFQNRNAGDAQVHGKAQSSPHIPYVLLGVIRQDHHCLLVACPNFGKCSPEEPGLVQRHPSSAWLRTEVAQLGH